MTTAAPVPLRPARAGALRKRLRHLPPALAVSGALLVAATVVGGLLRGVDGAIGAAVGVAAVAIGYVGSSVAVAWADSIRPRLVLPVGLLVYALKLALLAVGLALLDGWAGLAPMAVSIMVAVITWTATQAWWTWHAKIPYVDVD